MLGTCWAQWSIKHSLCLHDAHYLWGRSQQREINRYICTYKLGRVLWRKWKDSAIKKKKISFPSGGQGKRPWMEITELHPCFSVHSRFACLAETASRALVLVSALVSASALELSYSCLWGKQTSLLLSSPPGCLRASRSLRRGRGCSINKWIPY